VTDPRYPIGRFDPRAVPTAEELRAAVRDIAELPGRLTAALDGLTEEQLDTPYRDGGWTVRQLVHHVADSHINAFVRLRLALTEEAPEIRPYDQDRWAGLADSRTLPPAVSLQLLEALHRRWSAVLESLEQADFERPLRHPEIGEMTLAQVTALYGWHGRHHVAHVTGARGRRGS
jgi:uncharacterized damage-inducible protein DinB